MLHDRLRGIRWADISRCLSRMLRHEPWLYELELDEAGWVPLSDVLVALRSESVAWRELTQEQLIELVASAEKQRHEIAHGRIRALYGHSLPGRLVKAEAAPPRVLYHGTSPETLSSINSGGLRPMSRQYVHLSADVSMATEVGRRKSKIPVILEVKAAEAHAAGVKFFAGNAVVWLAKFIPPDFVLPCSRTTETAP